jgi:hypothetical protein
MEISMLGFSLVGINFHEYCLVSQLTGRESLRDLMIGLDAHKSKYYHLGFGKNVTRSNLAKANEKRNY